MTREVMQQALEALHYGKANKAVTILREALEQPEQEPVQRQPLTKEAIQQMLTATFSDDSLQSDDLRLIRATEAAHNIGGAKP